VKCPDPPCGGDRAIGGFAVDDVAPARTPITSLEARLVAGPKGRFRRSGGPVHEGEQLASAVAFAAIRPRLRDIRSRARLRPRRKFRRAYTARTRTAEGRLRKAKVAGDENAFAYEFGVLVGESYAESLILERTPVPLDMKAQMARALALVDVNPGAGR
jgi:hypothetical protein